MSKKIHTDEATATLRATIGPRLKAARKKLELTQEDAAEMIGISSEFFARMERGNALPSVSTLRRIAIVLKVTVDWLFGADASDGKAPVPIPGPIRDSRQVNYVVEKARSDPELTRTLIGLLKLCEKRAQAAKAGT